MKSHTDLACQVFEHLRTKIFSEPFDKASHFAFYFSFFMVTIGNELTLFQAPFWATWFTVKWRMASLLVGAILSIKKLAKVIDFVS